MLIKQLRDIKTFVSDKDGKLNSKKYVLSGKIFDCLFEIDAWSASLKWWDLSTLRSAL